MDRREYEEYYGEHIGTCRIHGSVLGSCDICEGEPDWRSQCCDASPLYIDGAIDLDESTSPPSGFCNHCHDNCVFEDARYDEI